MKALKFPRKGDLRHLINDWASLDKSIRGWTQQVQYKNYVSKLEPMRKDGSDIEILKEVEFGR